MGRLRRPFLTLIRNAPTTIPANPVVAQWRSGRGQPHNQFPIISLRAVQLSFWDDASRSFRIDPGTHDILIGRSASEILLRGTVECGERPSLGRSRQ